MLCFVFADTSRQREQEKVLQKIPVQPQGKFAVEGSAFHTAYKSPKFKSLKQGVRVAATALVLVYLLLWAVIVSELLIPRLHSALLPTHGATVTPHPAVSPPFPDMPPLRVPLHLQGEGCNTTSGCLHMGPVDTNRERALGACARCVVTFSW